MNSKGLNHLEGVAIGRLSLNEIESLLGETPKNLLFVGEVVRNPKSEAIPLVQKGVEIEPSKLAIFRSHGITNLVVVLVNESFRGDRILNSLKIEAIRKWEENEDVRVEAKKKAEVLQATAITIYRQAVEFCAQFSDIEFTNPKELEDKEMVGKIVALGTALENFAPAVKEAFYDLANGNGSILREIDELPKPTEEEMKRAIQFSFDVLRHMDSFNKLYRRERQAFRYLEPLEFEHNEVVRMFLAAMFSDSAFWGGWHGNNHEVRSAAIFSILRKYKETLPEGVEELILRHNRIDWMNHYHFERNEDRPSDVERVNVHLMRSSLILAVSEDFSEKLAKNLNKKIAAEEIAARYTNGPTLYEPSRHVNFGLPLYSYVLAALFNAHSVFPAGTILEFDRRDLGGDKKVRIPIGLKLPDRLCAISMGCHSTPELYPIVWVMWERRQGVFSQLSVPESGIVSMSSAFYHGRQSKQLCWAVGLRSIVSPHPHFRLESPRAIGLMDRISYKTTLGSVLVMLPNYKQHFLDKYVNKRR